MYTIGKDDKDLQSLAVSDKYHVYVNLKTNDPSNFIDGYLTRNNTIYVHYIPSSEYDIRIHISLQFL